jgi:hypothetical protein
MLGYLCDAQFKPTSDTISTALTERIVELCSLDQISAHQYAVFHNLHDVLFALFPQWNIAPGPIVAFNTRTPIPLLPQNPNFFMGYDAEIV